MSLLVQRPSGLGAVAALALVLSAGAGAGLLLSNNSLGLLIAPGVACAAALTLFLLQQPAAALYVALLFYLFPFGLRPAEIDLLYTIIANAALLLALCAWMLQAPFQRQPILWNGVCFLIALYIVWGGVTLLWAPDLVLGRKKLVAYAIGLILLFLIVQEGRTLKTVDRIMVILAMIGWTTVIAGVATLLINGYHPGDRLKLFDVNENTPALYLVLALPGVIWPVLQSSGTKRGLYMALSVVYILSTFILVLLSGSRGGALSLAVMLLALWFWKPLRPWGIVGGGLVVCMLISAPFLLEALNNRSMDNWGNEVGGRDLLWRASLMFIADHPLLGAGVGNGSSELTPYIASLTSDFDNQNHLSSHNPLLEVGVDTGIFGMLLYSSMCVSALWRFFHHRGPWYMREGPLSAYFPLVLCAGASYLVSWSKDGGLENHPTFFMLLALLMIPSHLSGTGVAKAGPAHEGPPRPVPLGRIIQR